MANLTTDELVAIVLVIVVGVVVFLEWRFLRSRREAKIQAAIEQDDAFNSIATARAIAQSLRDQGRDVLAGETLIHQAEGAYERKQFKEALEFTDKARTVLKSSKVSGDLIYCPAPKDSGKIDPAEECVPVLDAAKKLPQNYLEAKFIIETTADRLKQRNPEEVKEVRVLVENAQRMFDQENYSESLRYAMKARRILDEGSPTPAPKSKAATERIAGITELPSKKCPSCSASVSGDDAFCRKCGTRVSV